MLGESVTVDEFAHLPAGYSYLKTGEFHLYNRNPPLVKILAALPLAAKNAGFTKSAFFQNSDHWGFGYDFMYGNWGNYRELFNMGRTVIILIGLLGGCIVFFWAKELYGPAAGVFALFLYSLCPNMLAHSHLVTVDLGLSVAMLAALYFFYRFVKRRNYARSSVAGIFLGLAQLTKFSALILYPVEVFYLLFLALREKKGGGRLLGKLALMLFISVLVINAGYLFKGSFTQVKNFHFQGKLMQAMAQGLPQGLALPLPADYLNGFDLQNKDAEGTFFQFLMGEGSTQGWWYYYLVAFMFKTPLAFILLLALLGILWIKKKLPAFGDGEKIILFAASAYFLAMSCFTRINAGIRYVLPVFPLLYIFSSRIVLAKWKPALKFTALSLIAVIFTAESLSIYPHYLSFFNLLAGGPKNGYKYLIDSNIDWGQDLPSLKKYMLNNRMESIDLAYFGRVDPRVYGINYRVLEPEVKGADVAVSANYYQGYPYFILKEERLYPCPPDRYSYLRAYPIKERIGYSIFIVRVPDK